MKQVWQSLLYFVIALSSFVWLVKVPVLTHYLTEELGVPVSIEWVSIWPTETTMHHFTIEGPKQHRSAALLKAQKVVCRYLWSRGEVDIRDLEFDGVTIYLELVSGKSNWDEVLEELLLPKVSVPVVVRSCTMTHVTLELRDSEGSVSRRFVNRFEIRDLRSEEGFPTREFLQLIYQKME